MKNRIILIIIMAFPFLYGQDISDVASSFKAFEYKEVITLSQRIFASGQMTAEEAIELNRMKATSHYVLGQVDSAAFCFAAIISIDETYELDAVENSPKIITLFNQVKTEYRKNSALRKIQAQTRQENHGSVVPQLSPQQSFRNAMTRSIVLPGWGHYYIEQKKKGLILGAASAVALTSTLYFIMESNRLEKKYLNETVASQISGRYDDYNQAYQWRNISLAAYAALWLYAQIDLSNQAFFEIGLGKDATVHAFIVPGGSCMFSLKYKF